jgi:ABC-type polysaccharide/polyol phosphate export permease
VSDRAWLGDLLQWANPIAPFVDSVRELLYSGAAPSLGQLGYLVGVGLGALGLGLLVFRRLERDLAVIL